MLSLALLLDALIGDPDWLWRRVTHPVVLFGCLIDWLEARLNRGAARHARGALAVAALVVAVAIPAALLSLDLFFGVFEIAGAAVLIAQRSLVGHIRRVADGLRRSLAEGRAAVAMIVGRDPETLDRPAICRAAVESAAENFSDGVVAPAFWFLVAGLPGIAVYKAVNTADSMVGHRNDRYREFGWAAARLDDLLNWIPARLTGGLLCLIGGGRAALDVMLRDADLHQSPNAGWPEAAMAASLGLSLAGPRSYGGEVTDDPWLNPTGQAEARPADIDAAIRLLWLGWGVLLGASAVLWGIGTLF